MSPHDEVSDETLEKDFTTMLTDVMLQLQSTLLGISTSQVLAEQVKSLLAMKKDLGVPLSYYYQQVDTLLTGLLKLWGRLGFYSP